MEREEVKEFDRCVDGIHRHRAARSTVQVLPVDMIAVPCFGPRAELPAGAYPRAVYSEMHAELSATKHAMDRALSILNRMCQPLPDDRSDGGEHAVDGRLALLAIVINQSMTSPSWFWMVSFQTVPLRPLLPCMTSVRLMMLPLQASLLC
jgi:hypothetical protein